MMVIIGSFTIIYVLLLVIFGYGCIYHAHDDISIIILQYHGNALSKL